LYFSSLFRPNRCPLLPSVFLLAIPIFFPPDVYPFFLVPFLGSFPFLSWVLQNRCPGAISQLPVLAFLAFRLPLILTGYLSHRPPSLPPSQELAGLRSCTSSSMPPLPWTPLSRLVDANFFLFCPTFDRHSPGPVRSRPALQDGFWRSCLQFSVCAGFFPGPSLPPGPFFPRSWAYPWPGGGHICTPRGLLFFPRSPFY